MVKLLRNGKNSHWIFDHSTTPMQQMELTAEVKAIKIRLDLTKPRLDLLISANDILKEYKGYYAFTDVNCRTRAKIGGKFNFFYSIEDLQKLIDDAEHSDSQAGD